MQYGHGFAAIGGNSIRFREFRLNAPPSKRTFWRSSPRAIPLIHQVARGKQCLRYRTDISGVASGGQSSLPVVKFGENLDHPIDEHSHLGVQMSVGRVHDVDRMTGASPALQKGN
jgi:hypothetical protein